MDPANVRAPPRLSIQPPLLNSACPWATYDAHLRALLECPSTGAITIRTSLLNSFDHQPSRHRFFFFDPATTEPGLGGTRSLPERTSEASPGPLTGATDDGPQDSASLNNLGYSPLSLDSYLGTIARFAEELPHLHHKTVIFSVTGSRAEVKICYDLIADLASRLKAFRLAMEINLSCPNIPGAPPVAYDAQTLGDYLTVLSAKPSIPVGIKTPPYTHADQYGALASALENSQAGERLSFITATNTLGSCLVLGGDTTPVLPADGFGGMAGSPLHPLSLGNVAIIRNLLDSTDGLSHIDIIGVGGVSDVQGYRRMRAAGASAVALATALGKEGPAVFTRIMKEYQPHL